MADLITTKAAFPKSGGLAVANGAVSVNAGNGLHVNPTTGMVEVPVDTTAGLGYGSNGLEVEVDGSTIDFNASGQLQALGGGGGETFTAFSNSGSAFMAGNFSFSPVSSTFDSINLAGYYSDNYLILNNFKGNYSAASGKNLFYIDNATMLTNTGILMSSEHKLYTTAAMTFSQLSTRRVIATWIGTPGYGSENVYFPFTLFKYISSQE